MRPVTKCAYADRYKARKPPKCGCFVCETKWRLHQLEEDNRELREERREMKELLNEAISSANSAGSAASGALYVAQQAFRP